jgi:hypothetical protein
MHLLAMGGLSTYLVLGGAAPAQAMHIMEGFLPPLWAVFWWLAFLPFFFWGLRSLTKITNQNPELKLLLALSGAFAFVLSALKIPSVTGSCSHPTGTGLSAVLFGPSVMSVLGSMVLLCGHLEGLDLIDGARAIGEVGETGGGDVAAGFTEALWVVFGGLVVRVAVGGYGVFDRTQWD